MSNHLKILLVIVSSSVLVENRQLPDISSFEKEICIPEGHVAHRVWPSITEKESFVYAICDASDTMFFKEKHCNVSIETPALSSATFKDTCLVKITPDSSGQETLSNLTIQPFGDERIIFSWSQAEWIGGRSVAKLKILTMSNCQFVDLTLPTDSVPFIVSYGSTFDVGLRNGSYCRAAACKIRLNATGDVIDGPTAVSNDINLLYYYALIPVPSISESKGFYLSIAYNNDQELNEHLYKVYPDGSKMKIMTFTPKKYSSYSTSHKFVSVCTSEHNTTIICSNNYMTLNMLTNMTLEFEDQGRQRWFQPHNLEDGGLLLATGTATDADGTYYDSFDIIKLFPSGRRGRPLSIDGLNFTCRRLKGLFVVVTENDDDEFCFHFSCSRSDAYKFAVKCIPKSHVAMDKRSPAMLN